MRYLILILFAFFTTLASAQPGPRPNLPGPDRDRWDHQYRPHPGHVRHPRNCREWRREVRHHPRLILPYYCRYERYNGPPRPGPR